MSPTAPSVIDEELCRRCVDTQKARTASGEVEAKKEVVPFREVKSLLLSYQNILKIDNLVGFDRLVKLQLDNNIIEKIENLGHLTSLEALDLSFNNIAEITNLESLTNLTTLSLFSNRIKCFPPKCLDNLEKLQVLSLGNNLMTQLDEIMYLRPFAHLQAINFVGNPFCQEEEYRRYVLAHLKHIKYLDYRLVDQQAVATAKEQYQDELLDLEEAEQQQATQAEAAEEKAKRTALHRSANLKDMDNLLEEIMIKGDGDMAKLRTLQPFQEPLSQLREQVDSLTDEYIATVIANKDLKATELDDFTVAIEHAKAVAAAESKALIAEYDELAKQSLSEATDNPMAVFSMLNKANDQLYETLMDLEVSQSERYAESISTFESAYDELAKRNFELLQTYCGKLRDLESQYNEKLVLAGGELLERVASDHADNMPEEARALLQDKDTTMGVINTAHDARVSRLDAKEDELRTLEDQATKAAVKRAVDAEYFRNRTRVVEIWNLVNVVHKNELESFANQD